MGKKQTRTERVTTDAYRTGWENIFGEPKSSGELN